MSKLLVVDDEQSICWGLTRLGESLGYDVAAASSAEQAFYEVERQRPDAVILDVRLPGMDGLTAIERFQEQLGSVPIIVITAYGDLLAIAVNVRPRPGRSASIAPRSARSSRDTAWATKRPTSEPLEE